jgi:serine phosphatase RsbU (regulator of sigma subunit)
MRKQIILCVDDEQIVLNSLKNEINRHFSGLYSVEIAEDPEEAIEVAEFLVEKNHDIVVVISDYVMPKMKGDELLAKMHEIAPYARKILLTGQASIEGVTNAINNANLYRYLSKPWESNDLMMTISAAAESFLQECMLFAQNEELKILNLSLEQKVAERTAELRATTEHLQASIRYAKRIQNAVLPSKALIEKFFPEHFILFLPKDVVSGDFYWVAEKQNKVIIAAADCTGHGVPGAFMSLIGNELLNRAVHDREIHEPDKILSFLNAQMSTVWRGDNSNMRDGMDISVVLVDFVEKKLSFAAAKNQIAVFKNGEMQVFKGSKHSIDGSENATFDLYVTDIETVMRFYLYSDGFRDQFGGEKDSKFLSRRFYEMLQGLQNVPLQHQNDAMMLRLNDWKGKEKQTDDILVMGFEVTF